ncbi:hypothetical protein CIL03_12060 [Virgibacillus indicus]|uniref:Uncharacterized protein n=2 Tax=Virgibacillus indicus TaxID=2024554 RepID=A0A265N8Z8_9BACI|nr:hypothetical protein CIL03_12060 [Virgibacillus indicus]
MTLDEVISALKEAGLNTISLNPTSLYDLEQKEIITIYEEDILYDVLQFTDIGDDFNPENEGYYITIPELPYYQALITDFFNPDKLTIGDNSFYFIAKDKNTKLSTAIGFDETAMKQIKSQDLDYILRIENDSSTINNQNTVNTLLDLKDDNNSRLLFSGQDVIGYPNMQNVTAWTDQLHEAGYHFYTIEFAQQKGLQTIARNTDYNTIRLHSINLDNKTLDKNIEQAIRAVKERNIRSIFFHIQSGDSQESLNNAKAFVEGVHNGMPEHFNPGPPEPFNTFSIPVWMTAIVLAAGTLFTYLAAGVMRNKKLQLAASVFMLILTIAYFLLNKLLILQAFALIIAVITPIYAVLSTAKLETNKISKITFQFLKAIGISFAGIIIVVGILNGNAFITGFEIFRGVKLVYAIPILVTAVLLFWRIAFKLVRDHGFTLLKAEVKYWHLLIFLLIAAVGFYYLSRTGNAGTVSEIELIIRSTMEEILYVRPRTKEFLIGFPFYILALYVMGWNKIIGKLLLIPGVIGFLSIMNTFTHFHIPLHLSLLRTIYSIVIGYAIGMLFIYVYKICTPYIVKIYKKRWN